VVVGIVLTGVPDGLATLGVVGWLAIAVALAIAAGVVLLRPSSSRTTKMPATSAAARLPISQPSPAWSRAPTRGGRGALEE